MADLKEADDSAAESQDMSETIRATWREINSRGKEEPQAAATPAAEAAPAPAGTETAEAGDKSAALFDRPRDESGRFVKNEAKNESAAPAVAAETTPAGVAQSQTAQKYIPKWKKEALEKWGSLDPLVQAEVERREQDFHKGIEGYKTKAQLADEWEKAHQPYAQMFQQTLRTTPQQAAANLFATQAALIYGTPDQKAALLANIARQYGIQLPSGEVPQGQQQNIDPALQQVTQEVAHLRQMLTERDQAALKAKEQEAQQQIDSFKADKPYFEALMPAMTALLQTQQATSLQEAYDKAFLLNPATRSVAEAQQRERWEKERIAKAEAAKKAAAVNIRPKGVMPSAPATSGDMRETIARVARDVGLVN